MNFLIEELVGEAYLGSAGETQSERRKGVGYTGHGGPRQSYHTNDWSTSLATWRLSELNSTPFCSTSLLNRILSFYTRELR